IGEMAKLADSRALVGGNIGKCLLSETRGLAPDAPMVLELSSFMLENFAEPRLSPQVAVITNISPNHPDRHGTMQAYIEAKMNIIRHQRADDYAVLNADDPMLGGWESEAKARIIRFSVRDELSGDSAFLAGDKLVVRLNGVEEVLTFRKALRVPGLHN